MVVRKSIIAVSAVLLCAMAQSALSQSAQDAGARTKIQAIPIPPVAPPQGDAQAPWTLIIKFESMNSVTTQVINGYSTKDRCSSAVHDVENSGMGIAACAPGPDMPKK